MERRDFRGYLLLTIGLIAIAIIAMVSWTYLVPNYPRPIPGDNPEVSVETTAYIQNDIGFDPYIKSIQNRVLSSGKVANITMVKSFWFEDTITVELQVVSPSGNTIKSSKIIKIGETVEEPVTFVWRTRQTGVHNVIITLYNDKGVQIDQKSVTVQI